LAFAPLNGNWLTTPSLLPWSYEKYLGFAPGVMKEHFQLKEAKRMLFHPIKTGSWVNPSVAYANAPCNRNSLIQML